MTAATAIASSSQSKKSSKKKKKAEEILIRNFHEEISWACDLLLPFGWQDDSDAIDAIRSHLRVEPLAGYNTSEEQIAAVAFYRGVIFMDKWRNEQQRKQKRKEEQLEKKRLFEDVKKELLVQAQQTAEKGKQLAVEQLSMQIGKQKTEEDEEKDKLKKAAAQWHSAVDPSSEMEKEEQLAKEKEKKKPVLMPKPAPVKREVTPKMSVSCRELSIERYQRTRVLKQIALRRCPTSFGEGEEEDGETDSETDSDPEDDEETAIEAKAEATTSNRESQITSPEKIHELLEDLKETEMHKQLLLNQIKGPDVAYVAAENEEEEPPGKEENEEEDQAATEASSEDPSSPPDAPPPPPTSAPPPPARESDESTVETLLVKLEIAKKRQKRLEDQLRKEGIVIAEDIPYVEAKFHVDRITKRVNEIEQQIFDPEAVQKLGPEQEKLLRQEFNRIGKELQGYVNSLMLTDEYKAEEWKRQQEWEQANAKDNQKALEQLHRHMPVNIRHMSRQQQKEAGMAASMIRKFERTNVLRFLRRDPALIAKWHPGNLNAAWMAGLTLTERRALHCHFQLVKKIWVPNEKPGSEPKMDKQTSQKLDWLTLLTKAFKEALSRYQQHVNQTDGKTDKSHKCNLIGRQCPVRADLAVNYEGDLGFPVTGEIYEKD